MYAFSISHGSLQKRDLFFSALFALFSFKIPNLNVAQPTDRRPLVVEASARARRRQDSATITAETPQLAGIGIKSHLWLQVASSFKISIQIKERKN